MIDCPEVDNEPAVANKETGSNPGPNAIKPKDVKPNARVFAMTQEEDDDASDFVSGSILIQQVSAYVLFDCGATYSFTSKRFYKKIRHKPEKLEEPFQVATTECKTIETSEIHRDCRIVQATRRSALT